MEFRTFTLVSLVSAWVAITVALDNGLARTPQMGFNSWNQFGCNYNETTIHNVADAMVSTGLAKAGFIYLNLDDCWMDHSRNTTHCPNGAPSPCWQFDQQRFPSGGKALIDYVHSKGLKFGVYSSAGPKTCQGLPASLGSESNDAKWMAAMGVDYLKYDNCGSEGISEQEQRQRHTTMRDAIAATGHKILFSLCEWNGHVGNPFDWVNVTGNSWRSDGDIDPHWESVLYEADHGDTNDEGFPIWQLAGPGGWNDPDMLEIGVYIDGTPPQFLTDVEARSQFSLWSLMKAPLLMGGDPSNLTSISLDILKNPEVIAISQDKLGVQGHKLQQPGPSTTPASGDVVVISSCAYNTSSQSWRLQPLPHKAMGSTAPPVYMLGFSSVAGVCMRVSVNETSQDTHNPLMVVGACDGSTATQFVYNETTQALVSVMTSGGGGCVEVDNGNNHDGATVSLSSTCDGDNSQMWFADFTDPSHLLSKVNASLCLSAASRGEVWYGPLEGGDVACLLLNRGDNYTMSIECGFNAVFEQNVGSPPIKVDVHDLWANSDIGVTTGSIRRDVAPHSVEFFRLKKQ